MSDNQKTKISIDRAPGKITIESNGVKSELKDDEVRGLIQVLNSALQQESFHFEFEL